MLRNDIWVYAVQSMKENGCDFYRIQQPMNKIIDKEIFPAASSNYLNLNEQEVWLNKCDLLLTQTAMSEKFLEFIYKNKGKKRFVIDYDDNLFEVSPYSPSYQWHGTKEVNYNLPDGSVFKLRDGENGFNIEENIKRLKKFEKTLESADMVTTTTRILADFFKKYNSNVKVLKNAIDFDLWKPANIVKTDKVRICWQGSYSHYEDWWEIKDTLKKILLKHKNCELVVVGEKFGELLNDFPQDQVEFHGWVSIHAYPYKMQLLNIDIGLAPLRYNNFNVCKSAIKWCEYSSLNVPTIATRMPPYSVAINEDQTGLLCNGKDEWFDNIERLILDKKLRTDIGRNAREYVFKHYNIDDEVYNYESEYKSLFVPEILVVNS